VIFQKNNRSAGTSEKLRTSAIPLLQLHRYQGEIQRIYPTSEPAREAWIYF